MKHRSWSRIARGMLVSSLVAAALLPGCGTTDPSEGGTRGSAPVQTGRASLGDGTLSINVVGPAGEAVPGYRWILEEDRTYHVVPGAPDPGTLAVDFHRSYMPVVAEGNSAAQPAGFDSTKHHFVSVLPDAGYAIGGAQVAPGQTTVDVLVQPLPFPTAQITVQVFRDQAPINNAFDTGEPGLAGFSISLEDAGGRYGISAGVQSQDAFGNALGTTYHADGSVAMMGNGVILTDAEGFATIKNLSPGKYGVSAVPPSGAGWVQTSTIEGTKVIDAWVKANEPPYFMEFGPPGYHASIGFIQPTNDTTVLTGGATIAGQVVNLHMSRPPGPFYSGAPAVHTRAWVGLNIGTEGRGVYAQPTEEDGSFLIPDVPPGDYQLVVWDSALDFIFGFHGITVNPDLSCKTPGGSCDLGDVPVFQWFTRQEHHVFSDLDADGFRDPGEPGIPNMNVNLRWRDGTVYQAFPTDTLGFVPFDQIFPFFAWQVAEVDYTRLKPTGVTITVDDGGPINPGDPWTFGGQLNPQPQSENAGGKYRTETGPVLTQAYQGFLGQTSVFQWGKAPYAMGENGGISGVVYYDTTRAENDPRYCAPEPWQPGIPGVVVNLYDATGTTLLNTTRTDSWDDNVPTGCQGPGFTFRGQARDCFDGLRNFNQVRPGVFDGGYMFATYFPDGVPTEPTDGGTPTELPLPPGEYIVEVVPPPGYSIVKEEDKNVDFGDSYEPSPMQLPPECVGPSHPVPDRYSLFPLLDDDGNNVPPARAGDDTPLCTRKRVWLADAQNTAADFFLFTHVPIAGHIIGFVLDDAANEFDPNAPTFGEKFAPPWLPVSIRDWTGREISRTYSDEFGVYNALVPSTYTANRPAPSGMSPNMLTVCLNSPTMPSPGSPGGYVLDPYYNPQYSQFCYTFQYMPGTTTYLDTPVLPQAAFAGPDQYPLDCEYPSGTPRVWSVDGPGGGPLVTAANGTQSLTILAPNAAAGGQVSVPNPGYNGSNSKTIDRDFGFGPTTGKVRVGDTELTVVDWKPGAIVASVPAGTVTGALEVERGDNKQKTINAVTVTVGGGQTVRRVSPGGSIQAAIDEASSGDLILVASGFYDELLIMWKPVRLQGSGEGTIINALKVPAEKLLAWRNRVETLVSTAAVDLLPAQEVGFGGIEPVTLFTEEGPGVLVLARNRSANQGGFGLVQGSRNARIDGLTITGGDSAGGIVVNGYARYLQITNNRVTGNHSTYGGGIRVGHPQLIEEADDGLRYQSGFNDNIVIENNQVARNGALDGAGGGISLYTGSNRYGVRDNFVCGNFTGGDGAGIGHLGRSFDGVISGNTIIFNESFNQGITVSGGGIAILGQPPLAGMAASPGTGEVRVLSNWIIGNSAGAGDGGGVYLNRINGLDVEEDRNNANRWYRIELINNVIVNNVAALAGGGIALSDAANVRIWHDVVANNDSTATAGSAFAPGFPNRSVPQPAGIVSRRHSPELRALLPARQPQFSDPDIVNSIIWHNRSFVFVMENLLNDPPTYGLEPLPNQPPIYDDLAVRDGSGELHPRRCILTNASAYPGAGNFSADPMFMAEYVNGAPGQTVFLPEVTTALQATPAFDEGGNYIRVGFGPHTLIATDTLARLTDNHLRAGSPAVDAAIPLSGPLVAVDIDGQARPWSASGPARADIGADERVEVQP